MRHLHRALSALLLVPAVVWFLNGLGTLWWSGLYSYAALIPLSFKIHTVTLLSVTSFYIAVFLALKPHRPLRSFAIPASLALLSNAVYEVVFAFFISPHVGPGRPPLGGVVKFAPWLLAGIVLVAFLDGRYRFLAFSRRRAVLLAVLLAGFLGAMFVLSASGFFAQVQPYLRGRGPNPHNAWWALSKVLCMWASFPLLRTRAENVPATDTHGAQTGPSARAAG